MGGFADFVAGMKPFPKREPDMWDDHTPKEGEVHNPMYRRYAERVWGDNEADYLPEYGKDHWDNHPLEEIPTHSLKSPQKQLDKHYLKNMPAEKMEKPIAVTRTATGEHIIQDGNHRAMRAHATTGKIMARVFQSKAK